MVLGRSLAGSPSRRIDPVQLLLRATFHIFGGQQFLLFVVRSWAFTAAEDPMLTHQYLYRKGQITDDVLFGKAKQKR